MKKNKLNRRKFLKYSSIAGTLVVAPNVLIKNAWANSEVNVLAFGGYE